MFLNSYRTVVTFLSCSDVLGVVLALWICFVRIFKSLQNYSDTVTDIISFENHLESSSGHTLDFYPNLVKHRLKNVFLKKSPTRSSTML